MLKTAQNIFIIVAFLIVTVIIFYSVNTFGADVETTIGDLSQNNLNELATSHQSNFDNLMQKEIVLVEGIADSMIVHGNDEGIILDYFYALKSNYDFHTAYVVGEDGVGLNSNGVYVDISNENYFDETLEGNTVISDIFISGLSGDNVMVISVPIYENNQIVGVLAVEYPSEFLVEFLPPFFEGQGNSYIAQNDGTIIASNESMAVFESANLYENYAISEFEDGMTAEIFKQNVDAGLSGSLRYTINGNYRFAEYRALDVNDWIILLAAPYSVISSESDYLQNSVSSVNYTIIICCLALALVIYIVRSSASKEITKVAYFDEMTGLPNLNKFKIDATHLLQHNKHNTQYSILKLDIINFKVINEIFNFETGNKVIKAIADITKTDNFPKAICARTNKDEFLFFGDDSSFGRINERHAYEKLVKNYVPEISDHNLEFRYGVYKIEKNETDINEIINKVTMAHNFAKTLKNSEIYFYDDTLKKHLLQVTEITNKMHYALRGKEFKVFLQPKYSLKTQKIIGAEALVRWVEPDGKMIFPGDFIPVFEQNGFITQLDFYMFTSVCGIIKDWIKNDIECVPISVNFSKAHLLNPNFVEDLVKIVRAHGIPTKYLEIEITETAFIDNEAQFSSIFEQLDRYGFRVSMDDFGSGYSSLGALKNLKVQIIKLDRSFLLYENKQDKEKSRIVISSIIDMAKKLSIITVAEGIETQSQADFLAKANCDIAQGFFYAKPMPLNEFNKLLLYNA